LPNPSGRKGIAAWRIPTMSGELGAIGEIRFAYCRTLQKFSRFSKLTIVSYWLYQASLCQLRRTVRYRSQAGLLYAHPLLDE
jgi:hypothetical protein